jgi:hypothetical protein
MGPHADEILTSRQITLRSLESVHQEADAAGLAMLACLGSVGDTKIDIAHVCEEGHAIEPSPLPGRTVIDAPLWCGSAVASSGTVESPCEGRRCAGRPRSRTGARTGQPH